MTTPSSIIAPLYEELPGVDDVQDIMDRLAVILPAIGWTVPATDTYQTPPDPWGRYFKLALTRNSATKLHADFTDDQGRTDATTKMLEVAGVAETIAIFYSTRYLWIVRYATADVLFASLLSLAPESETAHNRYCIWNGGQATGGGFTASGTRRWRQIKEDGTYDDEGENLMNFDDRLGEEMTCCRDVAGGIRFQEAINLGADAAGNRIRGRIYNAIVCHTADCDVGDEKPVYIGGGTTAIFKAVNMSATENTRLLIRKS